MTGQLWVTALGGAAAGAVLTALASLITTVLNRRHEQRRWLLDRRLEAYTAFNSALTAWQKEVEDAPASVQHSLADLIDRYNTIVLLAPIDTTLRSAGVVTACTEVTGLRPLYGPGAKDRMKTAQGLLDQMVNDSDILLNLQRRDVQGGGVGYRIARSLPRPSDLVRR